MIVYNYNQDTKVFTFSKEATESPLEIGVYLIPAHSTTIAPPKTTGVEVARFINGAWVIVEDNRGLWYNVREPVEIIDFGPVPDGYTKEPAPYTQEELDRIAALETRIAAIEAEQAADKFHEMTPQEAKDLIEKLFTEADTAAKLKELTKNLFKRVAVYLLK